MRPLSSLRAALLLHLYMSTENSEEISRCERCGEWTQTVSRTFDFPLPSSLILASNTTRDPVFQWGEDILWVSDVDYHLVAVSYVKPGSHYVLTCRFQNGEMTSDAEEDNDAIDGWYFYDDTIDHGRLQKNPKRCKLPSGPRYKGYHVRSWYYITRQTLETRTLDRHHVDEIRGEISHLSNYEMINQLNVTKTGRKKRGPNQKTKPTKTKQHETLWLYQNQRKRPTIDLFLRNAIVDKIKQNVHQNRKKLLRIPIFGNIVQKDHNKTALDTID
jgi:hypothetical protein